MKTDARVRYTRMRIRQAFFQCLKEKPISRITVKELCDIAEINRATFYSHYDDPYDLMVKLENEALDDLRELAEKATFDKETGILTTLLKSLKEDGGETRLLASPGGDPNFSSRISTLFYEIYRKRVKEYLPKLSEMQEKLVYRFMAGGCSQVLSLWVEEGMTEKPETVAREMNEMCAAVLSVYIK